MRRAAAVLLLSLLGATAAPAARAAPPPIGHVWIIQLENKSYDQAFVDNVPNTYLWKTLPQAGALLTQYHGTGHASLDNYITQISGQAPNPVTQADCPDYVDVTPGIMGTDGQATGTGCVYPPEVKTLPDQLEAKGLTWKGYMEDMGNDSTREPTTCGNPQMNKADPTQKAAPDDQYAARHNPFVYFHSILDPPGRCAAHVVPLPPLASDLKSIATTPNFSYITPNLCDDGHDATPCAGLNTKGTHEGDLIAADAWLSKWVPVIMDSPAFRKDGLLLVTFDESTVQDTAACCEEPAGLSTPAPGIGGPGGGRTGAVAISPFITPGTQSDVPYNHYSLLKSLEDLFGIGQHLGYAAMPGLVPFGPDVYTRPQGGPTTMPGPIRPGDAGATGRVTPLKVKLALARPTRVSSLRARLAAGLRVRLTVTGTDRKLNPVQIRLRRGATTIASRMVKNLDTASFVLHLRASARARRALRRGAYTLRADVIHESKSVAHATVALRLR